MKTDAKTVELLLEVYGACTNTPLPANYLQLVNSLLEDLLFYRSQKGINPSVLEDVMDRYIRELDNLGDNDGGPEAGHGQTGRGD